MDSADRLGADATRVAASLESWIDAVTFTELDVEAVTTLLISSIVEWATAQGWRAYRRAPSVVPLPPPFEHRRSCVDVGCARPQGAPLVVEVDRTDRRRTVEKLLAEAAAGRVALWVRWGDCEIVPPGPPIVTIACRVSTRRGSAGRGRVFSRLPERELSAPPHTTVDNEDCQQTELFCPSNPSEVDNGHTIG